MAMDNTKSKLRSKLRWGVVGIFTLLLVAGIYDSPTYFNRVIRKINQSGIGLPLVPEKSFALGLDLQGGAHLVYGANVTDIVSSERAVAVEGVRDIIERRVNGLGVGEPSIQTTRVGEEYRIIVELPGVTDVNKAIAMIGETPILEFREQNNEPERELTTEERALLVENNINAKKKAEEAFAKIKSGELAFVEAVKEYSEEPQSKSNDGYIGFVSEGIAPEWYAWAKGANEGDLDFVENNQAYSVLKRGGEQPGSSSVEASHILICYLGASRCDAPIFTKKEAEIKAAEIFDQANADNFADLAKEFSNDLGAKELGGSLGFFGRGVMAPEFENAAFDAEVGQIVGPVETEFGYHVIYKTNVADTVEYELSGVLVRKQSEIDILPPQDPFKPTGLSGSQLERSEVVTDQQTGQVQVSLQFNGEGTELFRDLTERHIGEPIAIYLDGEPISIPVVQQAITSGRAQISGTFTLSEARLLTQRLNAGALPVPVEIISQQNVGASLGEESLQKSLKAGVVGLILVMLFMLLYYRLPGLLSIIALTLYLALTLALFKLIGVTLTLAGIAGFILSIGMAVDANILIFERLREELKEGKSLKAAVEEGFLRAWTSIRDGNISTLLTCVLLVWFGSSFVKGFAITLAIGILVSMFSAITITRMLLRFVVPWFGEKGNKFFLGFKENK